MAASKNYLDCWNILRKKEHSQDTDDVCPGYIGRCAQPRKLARPFFPRQRRPQHTETSHGLLLERKSNRGGWSIGSGPLPHEAAGSGLRRDRHRAGATRGRFGVQSGRVTRGRRRSAAKGASPKISMMTAWAPPFSRASRARPWTGGGNRVCRRSWVRREAQAHSQPSASRWDLRVCLPIKWECL